VPTSSLGRLGGLVWSGHRLIISCAGKPCIKAFWTTVGIQVWHGWGMSPCSLVCQIDKNG
jgi:hypothetical protein